MGGDRGRLAGAREGGGAQAPPERAGRCTAGPGVV